MSDFELVPVETLKEGDLVRTPTPFQTTGIASLGDWHQEYWWGEITMLTEGLTVYIIYAKIGDHQIVRFVKNKGEKVYRLVLH